MSTLITIILAVLVFSLLITVHELGHFLTAKWAGIRVNEFAIGMGPKIVSLGKGETKYSLRALPIGGYCAMEGEDEQSYDPRAFNNVSVLKRIAVVIAGAVMNILLGLIIMLALTNAQNLLGSNVVAVFDENAVSQAAGLMVGDEIVAINGMKTNMDVDILFALLRDQDGRVDFTVMRDGERLAVAGVQMKPEGAPEGDDQIWLDFKVVGYEKTFLGVIKYALDWTVSVVKMVLYSVFDLVTGQFKLNQLSGPVGVTSAIGESASQGLESLVLMVGFITINLGVMNLLPLPALDGGRLVFLVIELIRRKPINQKYEGYVHFAGFVLLMAFMAVITYSDIMRLITGG